MDWREEFSRLLDGSTEGWRVGDMDGIELELGSIVGVSVGRGVGQSMRAELLPVNLQSEGPSFFAKSVPLQIKYAPSPTTAKAPRTSTAREVLVI